MFTSEEKELLLYSLTMRRNIIETGEHNYSASDAQRMQRDASRFPAIAATQPKVRALSVDQMKLIIEIDTLMTKILHS